MIVEGSAHISAVGGRAASHRAGMTLLEILVVMTIVALLLSIGIPSVMGFVERARIGSTTASLNLLVDACGLYQQDFGAYPPSNRADAGLPDQAPYNAWEGSHLLYLFLTGWGSDPGTKGEPLEGTNTLATDDGCAGFGFRTRKRGKVYGPYNEAHELPAGRALPGAASQNNPPYFVSAFRHGVLYYRWDPAAQSGAGGYNTGENNGPGDINDYAKDGQGNFYRRDFLLICPGPDGRWTRPRDGGDDITNLKIKFR